MRKKAIECHLSESTFYQDSKEAKALRRIWHQNQGDGARKQLGSATPSSHLAKLAVLSGRRAPAKQANYSKNQDLYPEASGNNAHCDRYKYKYLSGRVEISQVAYYKDEELSDLPASCACPLVVFIQSPDNRGSVVKAGGF